MLSQQITQFISEVKTLNAVGCLKVLQKDQAELIKELGEAKVGIVCHNLSPTSLPDNQDKPALLIVVEEDYAANPKWAESIRQLAGYFLNVGV